MNNLTYQDNSLVLANIEERVWKSGIITSKQTNSINNNSAILSHINLISKSESYSG